MKKNISIILMASLFISSCVNVKTQKEEPQEKIKSMYVIYFNDSTNAQEVLYTKTFKEAPTFFRNEDGIGIEDHFYTFGKEIIEISDKDTTYSYEALRNGGSKCVVSEYQDAIAISIDLNRKTDRIELVYFKENE